MVEPKPLVTFAFFYFTPVFSSCSVACALRNRPVFLAHVFPEDKKMPDRGRRSSIRHQTHLGISIETFTDYQESNQEGKPKALAFARQRSFTLAPTVGMQIDNRAYALFDALSATPAPSG
jgi:hypothetical protein